MTTVYAVQVYFKKFNETSLSRECYGCLDDAQRFCESRIGTEKKEWFLYETEDEVYQIFELSVK